jgi:hypothetical protein
VQLLPKLPTRRVPDKALQAKQRELLFDELPLLAQTAETDGESNSNNKDPQHVCRGSNRYFADQQPQSVKCSVLSKRIRITASK